MYHKVILAGYLGRDPEMRYTPDGTPVTNFSVATTERWTAQDGTAQERTIWWRIAAWRRLAETCNQYLAKGRPVLVEGRMNPDPETGNPRIFQRTDGTAGASYELTAFIVRFLGPRDNGAPASAEDEGADVENDEDETEIPF